MVSVASDAGEAIMCQRRENVVAHAKVNKGENTRSEGSSRGTVQTRRREGRLEREKRGVVKRDDA